MKDFKKYFWMHAEWFLGTAGFLIAALIAWFLISGVTTVAADLGASLANPPAGTAGQHFDLKAAAAVDLKGLKPQ